MIFFQVKLGQWPIVTGNFVEYYSRNFRGLATGSCVTAVSAWPGKTLFRDNIVAGRPNGSSANGVTGRNEKFKEQAKRLLRNGS